MATANATALAGQGGMFSGTGIFSNIVIAIIILLAGVVIGKLVGKLLEKILHDISLDAFLRKALKAKFSAEELISVSAKLIVYLIAIASALRRFGFVTSMLNVVAVAAVIVILILVFLSIKEFIPNAIAGIKINHRNFLKEGERIRIKNAEGRIVRINLTETQIETKWHDMIYIPNTAFINNEVIRLRKKK